MKTEVDVGMEVDGGGNGGEAVHNGVLTGEDDLPRSSCSDLQCHSMVISPTKERDRRTTTKRWNRSLGFREGPLNARECQ